MVLHEQNGVKYMTFKKIDELGIVKHCFSTKIGGVSTGCYDSLNLGLNRGDSDENVRKNFERIATAVGFSTDDVVFSDQVHEKEVVRVTKYDRGKGLKTPSNLIGIDGLVTEEENVMLTTFYADCVPIFFVDPKKRVIALSHSGWKGTVLNIAKQTVFEMTMYYGCCAKDLVIGIGPSICADCFEVDVPVYEQFINTFTDIDRFVRSDETKTKYYIDLRAIIKQCLLDVGVLEHNIEIATECTHCDTDLFYSHRRMGAQRGSLAAFLQLTNNIDDEKGI